VSETVWITATPPTPNGPLHVGHLAGPYVCADVLRRFLRADGMSVLLTTGLDDHQSYVAARGDREGRSGSEIADEYGAQILDAWTAADIAFDRICRPRAEAHYSGFVTSAFRVLYQAGHIVAHVRPLPYCRRCERWLYEAYLSGRCPHCGEDCGGNACEVCGRPNECGDMLETRCALCDSPAEMRPCERLYLPLAPFEDRLQAFWGDVEMPPHLRTLCALMLHEGLPEIAVSHPGSWGLQVPIASFGSHRVYAWLEMALGYLLERGPSGIVPAQGAIQLFGFDNGYFHAALMPAVYMALQPGGALPQAFIVNEFYQLEGLKFSTSRNHAVWALPAIAEAGSDALRFHVLSDRPWGRATNLSHGDLERTRSYLREHWSSWLQRLLLAVQRDCAGEVPQEAPQGPAWRQLASHLLGHLVELRAAYSPLTFDPRRATALLDEIVACAVDFGYVHEFERLRPGDGVAYRSALTAQLAVAAALAVWAAPVMPAGARRLAALLGIEPDRRACASALAPPPAGTRCVPATGPIFGAS
jgi:methionyl-tRNA synthetase